MQLRCIECAKSVRLIYAIFVLFIFSVNSVSFTAIFFNEFYDKVRRKWGSCDFKEILHFLIFVNICYWKKSDSCDEKFQSRVFHSDVRRLRKKFVSITKIYSLLVARFKHILNGFSLMSKYFNFQKTQIYLKKNILFFIIVSCMSPKKLKLVLGVMRSSDKYFNESTENCRIK